MVGLLLMVGGCGAAIEGGNSRAATGAVIEPLELRYEIYLARLEGRVTVSEGGWLRFVRTDNKSFGVNDMSPSHERVEVREGQLTGEQIRVLKEELAGWAELSAEPYGGVADGGWVSVRYGGKEVSGGSLVPERVVLVQRRLMEWGREMAVVGR